MELGSFDAFVIFLFSFCAIIGLIRGFIRELFSLFNWILAFYLLNILKPVCAGYFLKLIKIPFLADIILNLLLFTTCLIIVSVLSNYLANIIKKIVPYSLDIMLGVLFGFIKAYIILFLTISTIRIVYNNNDPEILENSIFKSMFFRHDDIDDKIKILLGDFLNEKEDDIDKDEKEEIDVQSKPIIDKKNIDIIERRIDNLNKNGIIENNIDNLDSKIENILEVL